MATGHDRETFLEAFAADPEDPGRGFFAVARLGQLYLDDGVWEGQRIPQEGWVADASTCQIANPQREEPDWRQGYGFHAVRVLGADRAAGGVEQPGLRRHHGRRGRSDRMLAVAGQAAVTTTAAPGRAAGTVPAAARAWWTIAAVVTNVSLGMPWKESTLWPIYNVYNPWNCGVDYGGEDWASSQWCFQSLPTYSWYEGEAAPGYQTPIRIFVPLALIALFVGVRSGRRRLMILGATFATIGAVLPSGNIGPGQTVYVLGVLALWIGLVRAGVVSSPAGRTTPLLEA